MRRLAVLLPLFAAALLAMLAAGPLPTTIAQEATSAEADHVVVGPWRVLVVGPSGRAHPALAAFSPDGTVVVAEPPALPAAPGAPYAQLRFSPGVGAWEAAGEDAVTFEFDLLAVDEVGSPIGVFTVRAALELAEGGDRFDGAYDIVITDPSGTVGPGGAGTLTASRIVAGTAGTPAASPVAVGTPAEAEATPPPVGVLLPEPLDELVAAWNARDPQRIAALYTEDAVVEEAVLGGPVSRGPDEIAAWAEGNFAAVPDLRIGPRSGFVAGDQAVLVWTYAGTYTGEFPGLPPGTGQVISFPGVSVFELRDGMIARETLYYDPALLLSQLGLAPGTPAAAPAA